MVLVDADEPHILRCRRVPILFRRVPCLLLAETVFSLPPISRFCVWPGNDGLPVVCVACARGFLFMKRWPRASGKGLTCSVQFRTSHPINLCFSS